MNRVIRTALRTIVGVCWLVAGLSLPAFSAVRPPMTYRREVKHDTSPPLRNIPQASASMQLQWFDPDVDERKAAPEEPFTVESNPAVTGVAGGSALGAAPSTGLSFDGVPASGWAVPDTNGAAGATQYVQWVNTRFAVYNKATGARVYGPAAGNTVWSGFGGGCQADNNGDPIVQYDKAANRWIMMQHAILAQPYLMCVAVSTTSDATGSYYRYALPLTSAFTDYPKLGVWPDAYYVTSNLQSAAFMSLGAQVCALDRNAMLSGGVASSICFQLGSSVTSLLPSDLDGHIAPPAGSPNHLLNLGNNALNVWQFHVDFQTPSRSTLNGPTSIPVTAFTKSCGGGVCIPQSGTSQLVDSLGDRLMYRLAYRHFADGHEAMVVTHTVGNPAAIRWYEIRNPGGLHPVMYQSGTYAPDANWRWMGSIAMDKVGDIAVGYSESSASLRPSISYAGRVRTDPAGTFGPQIRVITSTGVQSGSPRWGDYSSMSVDPVDDCTFWYTNQYLKSTGSRNWSTRIFSFKFPSCQ